MRWSETCARWLSLPIAYPGRSNGLRRRQVLYRGLQQHPESVQIKVQPGAVEMRDHHPAQAIEVLEPLAGEKDSQLLNLLASAYTQANRPDDAFHTLENAILLSPTDETNYLDLAICAWNTIRKSIGLWRRARAFQRSPRQLRFT